MTGTEALLFDLGLPRAGTGGGCEGAESPIVGGLYILVTGGKLYFPDGDTFFIGVFSEDHSEPLWHADGLPIVELSRWVSEAYVVRADFNRRGVRS